MAPPPRRLRQCAAGSASSRGCAGAGGSSRPCAPRWCCCSCSRSPASLARCCRSRASTRRRSASTTPRTRRWRRSWPGCPASTFSARPGSRRSTCCSSHRWRAACCRAATASPGRQGSHRRRRHGTSAGCRRLRDFWPSLRRTGRSTRPLACCAGGVSGSGPVTAGCRQRRATCTRSATCCSTWPCSACSSRWPSAGCSATRPTSCWSRAARSPTPRSGLTSSILAGWSAPATCSRSASR